MTIQAEYSHLTENDIMNNGDRSLYSISSNGKTRLPWDGAGAPGVRRDMTINDLMRNEHLNWDVSMEPVWVRPPRHYSSSGSHDLIEVPNKFAVQRMDTGAPLGVGSSKYEIVQNIDVMQWFRPLFDSGLCEFESAGNFQGGKKCWVMVKMYKKPLMAVKDDPILPYLMFQYGFDGRTSIQIHPVSVRLFCLNQMPVVNQEAKEFGIKLLHTKGVHEAMESVQQATVQAYTRMKDTEKILKKLADRSVNQESLKKYFEKFLKIPYRNPQEIEKSDKKLRLVMENERKRMDKLFAAYEEEAESMPYAGTDTLYHAYNAVTRHLSHERYAHSANGHWDSLVNGRRAENRVRALQCALEAL